MTTPITYSVSATATAGFVDAFDRAFQRIEDVIDVEFVSVDYNPAITVNDFNPFGDTGNATVGLPSTIWINPGLEDVYAGWADNTYSGLVPIHELLHSLGLQHPHEYGDPATMLLSTVSYEYTTSTNGTTLYPHEPGLKDIFDLGEIYGYNSKTSGDGTVHRVASATGLDTVWDLAGAHDLLDLSSLVVGCLVDLGAGLVDLGGTGWAVLSGIEDVRLGGGADTVQNAEGSRVIGLTKADVLLVDDDALHKLTGREKRAEGLAGKWWSVDGSVLVQWSGGKGGLDALVVEES